MATDPTLAELRAENAALRKQFEELIEFLPDALFEVDLVTVKLTYCNRMAHIVLGYEPGSLIGAHGSLVFPPEEFQRAVGTVRTYLAEHAPPGTVYQRTGRHELQEVTMRRKDGSTFVAETQSSFALDDGGRPVRMRTVVRDVSERKALEAQLEALSLRDPLTGCYNRHYLERLRSDLERPTARWSCLMLDLRGLKSINDTYGHEEGDRVLRGFAHFLGLHHRSDDVLLRLGGDEFALLLPATDEPEAQAFAERIQQQARGSSPAHFDIGVAARRPGEALDAVLDRADRAMYAARGRRVEASTPPPA